MNLQNRRKFILKEIEERGSVSVAYLALHMCVSEMTIRRDLTDLDGEGIISRIHGGAVSARGRSYEPPLTVRATENLEAKRRIGKMAAGLVAEGDSVAIDTGSTALEVARNLIDYRNLTVVTSSLNVANLLFNKLGVRLILSGGMIRNEEASLIGKLAELTYESLFVDRLFLGVGAIDISTGMTEYNWDDSLIKQAMIRSAKEIILIADSTKFNKIAFARVAPLSILHQIVTDKPLENNFTEELARLRISIHFADQIGNSQDNSKLEGE
jgi:DeoR family transcriptional regulator, fructose operon transcriptional repressor